MEILSDPFKSCLPIFVYRLCITRFRKIMYESSSERIGEYDFPKTQVRKNNEKGSVESSAPRTDMLY